MTKVNETIATWLLRRVLESYDELPPKKFRGYLVELIAASDRIDNTKDKNALTQLNLVNE